MEGNIFDCVFSECIYAHYLSNYEGKDHRHKTKEKTKPLQGCYSTNNILQYPENDYQAELTAQ